MALSDKDWDTYQDYVRLENKYFDVMLLVTKDVIEKNTGNIFDKNFTNKDKAILLNAFIKHHKGTERERRDTSVMFSLIEKVKDKVEDDDRVEKAKKEVVDKANEIYATGKMQISKKVAEIIRYNSDIKYREFLMLPPKIQKKYKKVQEEYVTMYGDRGFYNKYVVKNAKNNRNNDNKLKLAYEAFDRGERDQKKLPEGGAHRTRKNSRSKRKTHSKRR